MLDEQIKGVTMNVLTIKTMNDNSIIRSLLNYPTEDDALSAFYNELAYATSSENIEAIVVELIDDNGHVKKCDRYSRTVVRIPEESEENE